MHGLKDNDTWHAHHQGDWGVVDKVQGQSFRVFQTKSHYVIGAALDDPDLQWSGIVAAYAQQNHPVIDFHDKNNMTPFDFQTILDNTSYLIKAEKEQQKGK